MGTALVAPGRAMLFARGRAALWRALRDASGGGVGGGTFAGPYPSAIAGISGWWDAGTFDGLLDASARPLPAWNSPAASVADKRKAFCNAEIQSRLAHLSADCR